MRIHYHSDCYFFAGCENILANILNNDEMRLKHTISFSYPKFDIYTEGLRKRIKKEFEDYPLFLADGNKINYWMDKNKKSGLLLFIIRAILKILQETYIIHLIDYLILRKVLKKIKPDIVHINSGGYPAAISCRMAAIAAYQEGVKKIYYHVNNIAVKYEEYGIIKRIIEKKIDSKVKKNVNMFITGSIYTKKKLSENREIEFDKIKNIPNTIIPRKITKSIMEVKKEFGIEEKETVFVSIAILTKRKGHEVLIKAFSILLDKINKSRKPKLIIEGRGEEEEKLKALVTTLGIDENVVFIGDYKNIYDIYNITDVFVLSSISNEDFPNTILEAMYMGKAIIGTRLAGIPEEVMEGENGFLVDCGDEKALALAMNEFVINREQINIMGNKSKKIFEEKFSYDTVMKKIIDLY